MNWKKAADDQIVCYCKNVSKAEIVHAIKQGNTTLKLIQEKTSACTGGNCKQMNPSGACCSADILSLIALYTDTAPDKEEHCCCCS